MSANVITIQNPNQLPQDWTGVMRGEYPVTLAQAQVWADKQGATIAYWIEPIMTVFVLAQ